MIIPNGVRETKLHLDGSYSMLLGQVPHWSVGHLSPAGSVGWPYARSHVSVLSNFPLSSQIRLLLLRWGHHAGVYSNNINVCITRWPMMLPAPYRRPTRWFCRVWTHHRRNSCGSQLDSRMCLCRSAWNQMVRSVHFIVCFISQSISRMMSIGLALMVPCMTYCRSYVLHPMPND